MGRAKLDRTKVDRTKMGLSFKDALSKAMKLRKLAPNLCSYIGKQNRAKVGRAMVGRTKLGISYVST